MSDGVHFDGDPETDSTRRQMERVLKSLPPRHGWSWFAAGLGAGGVWLLWRLGRSAVRPASADKTEPAP